MGLVERDFIMRLVKQLVELLARALKLKAEGKEDEALELLDSGCQTLLGIPYSALALVDSKSAADLLNEPARIAVFGRLLEERANIEAHQGKTGAATTRRNHALEIYAEALKRSPSHAAAIEGVERVRAAMQTVSG